jgi:hypothetical protein
MRNNYCGDVTIQRKERQIDAHMWRGIKLMIQSHGKGNVTKMPYSTENAIRNESGHTKNDGEINAAYWREAAAMNRRFAELAKCDEARNHHLEMARIEEELANSNEVVRVSLDALDTKAENPATDA